MRKQGLKKNGFGLLPFYLVALLLILTLIPACGDDDDDDNDTADDDDDDNDDNDDNDDDEVLKMEAGYFVIEPVDFTLRNGDLEDDFTSAETRIWYEFQPAFESPKNKPLVLLFNGGPGCATHFLFGFGTATWVVAPNAPDLFENPYSWRQFANLLYVDARGTGFSYGMVANPENESTRIAEFDTKNYNVYLDAGDFIRVLLRFLKAHPSIQENPVVIAGESYGGTRSIAILNLLLRYFEYGGADEAYQDVSLVDEIQEHFNAVFPDKAGLIIPPETIVSQFGRQILIEPLITGNNQFTLSGEAFEEAGSIIYQIADETDTTYVPCDPMDENCDPFNNALDFLTNTADRDYYVYPEEANWTFEQGYLAVDQLTTLVGLSKMTQTDPTNVAYLYSTERDLAYRLGEIDSKDGSSDIYSNSRWQRLPPFARFSLLQCLKNERKTKQATDGELPDTFGALNPWDTYHIDCSFDIEDGFYSETAEDYGIDPVNDGFGELFLYNLMYVKTFITHAALDLIIYAPVIPDSIALYDQYVEQVATIDSAVNGEERPGWIEVTYKDGAFGEIAGNETRMIRFPTYNESGHTVELNQPDELFEDVRDWLGEN